METSYPMLFHRILTISCVTHPVLSYKIKKNDLLALIFYIENNLCGRNGSLTAGILTISYPTVYKIPCGFGNAIRI